MSARMLFPEAARLGLSAASDDQLVAAWHAHASKISYLNADDYGTDWKLVPTIAVHARQIESVIRDRNIARPTGSYLMTDNDRIDWETGDWSPGWQHKKRAALALTGAA